jgi:hypothetical protein
MILIIFFRFIYNELGDFDAALNFNNKALSFIDDKKIPRNFNLELLLITMWIPFVRVKKTIVLPKYFQRD